MKDRGTVLALLIAAVLLEALLLFRSGLIEWLLAGAHSAAELRGLLADWRVLLSVVLVTLILWLAWTWFRLGAAAEGEERRR
jgi:hypothetical protein